MGGGGIHKIEPVPAARPGEPRGTRERRLLRKAIGPPGTGWPPVSSTTHTEYTIAARLMLSLAAHTPSVPTFQPPDPNTWISARFSRRPDEVEIAARSSSQARFPPLGAAHPSLSPPTIALPPSLPIPDPRSAEELAQWNQYLVELGEQVALLVYAHALGLAPPPPPPPQLYLDPGSVWFGGYTGSARTWPRPRRVTQSGYAWCKLPRIQSLLEHLLRLRRVMASSPNFTRAATIVDRQNGLGML
ncbi:unnamed protein product [Rhizoctonia solani]|uniref:Uncharacterized protein n=1 Tax=Rhizoctonia solani TaxID=456999 RepID=A0A8H3HZM2_9AGAM|nr:unnamed protein product [Rhizoctonia solani]